MTRVLSVFCLLNMWSCRTPLHQSLCSPTLTYTGFGESYSSQFVNSLSPGDTSSNTGVLAGTLTGAAKATIGAVSTSLKKSAESQSIGTSKSGEQDGGSGGGVALCCSAAQ